jgi:predicted dienelactone hydrolase
MHPIKCLLAATLSLAVLSAQAAGFRLLDIPASQEGPALRGAVWSPCAQPASEVRIGPYVMSVAKDCPIVGSKLPLVVVSHGWSGTFLGHHDTAETLADAGFVVVAVNHADNALSPRRYGDFSALIERPTDIKRAIDYMLGAWPDAAKLDARRVGFFVAIGANPVFGNAPTSCADTANQTCSPAGNGEPSALTHDPRIKAAVIADPLSKFFSAESWKNVPPTLPVQLWSSEYGGDGVTPESVAAVAHALAPQVEFHRVSGAQHFDFLPPCPPQLAQHNPEICADPQGFDRAAFHKELNAQVLAFFNKNLPARP